MRNTHSAVYIKLKMLLLSDLASVRKYHTTANHRRRLTKHIEGGGSSTWAPKGSMIEAPLPSRLESLGSVVSSPVRSKSKLQPLAVFLRHNERNLGHKMREIYNFVLIWVYNIIGGSWLDKPYGQNIGGEFEPLGPKVGAHAAKGNKRRHYRISAKHSANEIRNATLTTNKLIDY